MNATLRFQIPAQPIRYVRGRDLLPHPLHWRTHSRFQLDALCGVLAEVGLCDVLKGYERADGRIQLIDGHARRLLPDQDVPVLLLDMTEAEAQKLLAVFDPLSGRAGVNARKLNDLVNQAPAVGPTLLPLLEDLLKRHATPKTIGDRGRAKLAERFQILIEFEMEADQSAWLERLAAEGLRVRSLIS